VWIAIDNIDAGWPRGDSGSHARYTQGCRCDDCKEAHRRRAADYRQRMLQPPQKFKQTFTSDEVNLRSQAKRKHKSTSMSNEVEVAAGPGPVELGVAAEIDGLASEGRPGLAQVALALARVLNNPKV